MKKFMTIMLGLSFVLGTATMFAEEKGGGKQETKKKGKKGKKKADEETKKG